MLTSLLVTPFWMPGMLLYSIVSAGLEGAARRARTGELPTSPAAGSTGGGCPCHCCCSLLPWNKRACGHACSTGGRYLWAIFLYGCLSASALSSVARILRSSAHCSPRPGARLRTFPQRAAPPGLPADITNHWLPMWLAPNLITLLGLSALLLSYAVAAAHQPDFSGFAPLWLYASRCGGSKPERVTQA